MVLGYILAVAKRSATPLKPSSESRKFTDVNLGRDWIEFLTKTAIGMVSATSQSLHTTTPGYNELHDVHDARPQSFRIWDEQCMHHKKSFNSDSQTLEIMTSSREVFGRGRVIH